MFAPFMFLFDFKILLDIGLKKGNKFVIENTQKEIDKQIDKVKLSINKMQKNLIIKLTLYFFILIIALVINRIVKDSNIPLFLISVIYIVIFVLLILKIIKNIKLYFCNKEIIHEYFPKYIKYKKNNTNKEALTCLLNEIVDKKINESIRNKIKNKKINNLLIKIKDKSKFIKQKQEKFCAYAYNETANKLNEIIKKRIIIYGISFFCYVIVIALANELVIKYYYDGNKLFALIYPLKSIVNVFLTY